jgi:hypothetical protein
MRSWMYAALLAMGISNSSTALPLGDTQGMVTAVRIRPAAGTVNSFEVWFTQVQNDRWGCLGNGYVVVYDNGLGISPESFKQIFVLATIAQTTGRPLALDSSGANPCTNVSMAWVVN